MSRGRAGVATLIALHAVAVFAAPAGIVPVELEDPSDGSPVRIQSGARALHIVLFATWCQPCLKEMRGLADLESRWGERGYRLVLVAVPTRQTAERLAGFVAEHDPPGRVLFDRRGVLSRAAGVEELPAHVVLDESGRVVLRAARLADGVAEAVAELVSRKDRP